MAQNTPLGNCGDGFSVNTKSSRLLLVLYGMPTGSNRCSAHAADGSLKRIARSKTMSVDQVVSLYEALRSVVAHFENSSKSKEQLNEAISILELHKGVHMMSWCATRMGHFLTACVKFNELLVAVYNTMYTSDLKKEERDCLFSAENIFTMKVMVDVNTIMYGKYLRAVDYTGSLVSMSYYIAHHAADMLKELRTPIADAFVASLTIDRNGNINFQEVCYNNAICYIYRSGFLVPRMSLGTYKFTLVRSYVRASVPVLQP